MGRKVTHGGCFPNRERTPSMESLGVRDTLLNQELERVTVTGRGRGIQGDDGAASHFQTVGRGGSWSGDLGTHPLLSISDGVLTQNVTTVGRNGQVVLATGWMPQLPFLVVCALSFSVMSGSVPSHGPEPSRLLCPWNFPSKNTGVGHHSSSRGSSQPRDQTHISCTSCIGRQILSH